MKKIISLFEKCAFALFLGGCFAPSIAFAAEQAEAGGAGRILDIILVIGFGYFIIRRIRGRSSGEGNSVNNNPSSKDSSSEWRADEKKDFPSSIDSEQNAQSSETSPKKFTRYDAAEQSWDRFRSQPANEAEPAQGPSVEDSSVQNGFDVSEFVEGAKFFYNRYQGLQTEQDVEPIKPFLSDAMYVVTQNDLANSPEMFGAQVMLLDARLADSRTEADVTYATVLFSADLRHSNGAQEHLRTVWEFFRDESLVDALWKLDKISRVDH